LIAGDAVTAFVAEFFGWRDFGEHQAIGFTHKGELIAGFVFHGWNPDARTIEITAYATSPRWATRGNVCDLFDYPFNDAGCQLLYAWTDEWNAPVRRAMRRLGATEYVIPRMAGPDRPRVLTTLAAEAWLKWKEQTNG
jgi:RimJ/RimL family protein N-acetyltransferase